MVRELVVEAKRWGFALPRPSLRPISPVLYRHAKGEAVRHGERLLKRQRSAESTRQRPARQKSISDETIGSEAKGPEGRCVGPAQVGGLSSKGFPDAESGP